MITNIEKEIKALQESNYQTLVMLQGLLKETQTLRETIIKLQPQTVQNTPVQCKIHGSSAAMNVLIDGILTGKYCAKCYDGLLKAELKDFKEVGL